MRRKRPPQVATIGSTIAAGLDIAICCEVRECRRSRTLDLEAPARELGPSTASPTSSPAAGAGSINIADRRSA